MRDLPAVRDLLDGGDFVGALAAIAAALAVTDPDPVLHRLRAEALVGLLDYPAAVAALSKAPGDGRTLGLRIRLLGLLGRDEEARRAVAELLALDSVPAPEARRELAIALRESGLVPEARRVLGPPAPGEQPAVVLERGRLRLAEGDYEGALPLLRAAAAGEGAPAGAAYELGRCLAAVGRRPEAVSWLRRALARSPGRRAVRFRLGQLLVQDPDPARAAEGERLLDGYEESRLRERRRALLLTMVTAGESRDEESAGRESAGRESAGRESAATDRRDLWVQLLGLLLDGADGDPEERAEAARVLAAASARFPGDPAFRIGRARLLLSDGDPSAAAALLAPLVPAPDEPLGPVGASAARWLGEARLRGGDPPAAAAHFGRVLDEGADRISPRVRSAAATAFAMSGDPARALAEFDRLLAGVSGARRAAPLGDSAMVLEMLDRPAEAESRYRAALDADPAHVPAALGLAELLLRRDRTAEAAAVLRRALEISPGNEALADLLTRASPPGGGQGSSAGVRAAVRRPVISSHAAGARRSARSSPVRRACASPPAATAMRTDSGAASAGSSEPSTSSRTEMVQRAPSSGRPAAATASASVEFSL